MHTLYTIYLFLTVTLRERLAQLVMAGVMIYGFYCLIDGARAGDRDLRTDLDPQRVLAGIILLIAAGIYFRRRALHRSSFPETHQIAHLRGSAAHKLGS
jgi:multisubunit Na+/H+ antiporter MnhB subunit